MAPPYFSVVIDNYNYGRYIGQAIDGILAQTFPASEVETVVVDDGSTDDSREVVARYGDKVRLVAKKNAGQAAAFKTGFEAARGQVICLLDSDDYWEPDKLSAVADKLKDPSIGIVQHYLRDVDAENRPLANPLPDWPEAYSLEDFLAGDFVNGATSGMALRRSVLDQVLPVPNDIFWLYDDYLFDHGLFVSRIGNIPRILGYHRIHGANNWAMGYLNPVKLEGTIDHLRRFRAYIEPKLRERGLKFSDRYDAVWNLDIAKREVLLAMQRGQRRAAFGKWRALMSRYGATGLGCFRGATLALALVSPALYFKAYELYERLQLLVRARQRLLPEPGAVK